MIEQVKIILANEYQLEINKFDELKDKIEDLEYKMKDNTSEEEYNGSLKELNKKYGFFKRRSKEYKDSLNEIKNKYYRELKSFETMHNEYVDLRAEAGSINVYVLQKQLDQVNNAASLEDLKMSVEEANELIVDKSDLLGKIVEPYQSKSNIEN